MCCSSRRQHTSCALVTGAQPCALPIFSPCDIRYDQRAFSAHGELHPRPNQRTELTTSHHPMGLTIAIHEHGGAEPPAIQPSADRYPIKFQILVVEASVGTEPALLDPGVPAKIDRKSTRLNSSH